MQDLELIRKYAHSWNVLDISHVEPYFAENITYISKRYPEAVVQGKTEVLNELRSQITNIKELRIENRVYAEIGFCSPQMVEAVEFISRFYPTMPIPGIEVNEACVVMAQESKEKIISVVLLETSGNLIKKLLVGGMGMFSVREIVRTGEYPGIKPLTKEEEKEQEEMAANPHWRHFTWFESPVMTYLRVSRQDLITLNVWRDMTSSSYGGEDFAYLEIEVDAYTFLYLAEKEWELSFECIEVPDFPSTEFLGEKLQPLEEDPRCYWCQTDKKEYCECEAPECPICGDVAGAPDGMSLEDLSCGHLLAGWDDGGYTYSILKIEKGISNEAVNSYDWTEKELETAFAEALPLYNCSEDGYVDVESTEFWDVLAELIPEIKSDSFYDTPTGAMIGWGATMYCAEDPDKVKVQAEALLQKLKEGYNQLAKLLPEK